MFGFCVAVCLFSCYNWGAGSLKGGARGKYSTTEGVVLCKTQNRLLWLTVKVREDWGKTGRGQKRQTLAKEDNV